MALWMKFKSKIKGSGTAEGEYKDAIKLSGVTWTSYRMLNLVKNQKDNRLKAGIEIPPITMSYALDASTHDMLDHIFDAAEAVDATLTRVDDKDVKQREYEFSNVLIESVNLNKPSGDSPPGASFTITFTKMEVKDYSQKDKGSQASPKTVSYDLVDGKGG